ncbi:MAG: helix-turn-helix transcriptional regulator [Spirochaetales bacterium]|nr:helix-turn-helix transcriptional regulator [Spirochaetales bacterium]
MGDVKINNIDIIEYDKQPGEREIHRKSGFRISHFQRGVSYEPLEKPVPRRFSYYSICHLIEGKGWYWTPGDPIRYFSAGEGVVSTPGFVQSYGGDGTKFVEDFICFDGPVADFLFQSGVFDNGIVSIGKSRRLLPVIQEALNLSDAGQIRANGALQQLLYDLFREREEAGKGGMEDKIGLLLNKLSRSQDRWWTVGEMASFCNLSENQFRRVFRERTGMGPKHYIDSLKIQIAAEQILSSRDKLDDISARLGYRDRFHFSKVFKRIKGISPDTFRRNYPL